MDISRVSPADQKFWCLRFLFTPFTSLLLLPLTNNRKHSHSIAGRHQFSHRDTPTALSPLQKVWPSKINPNLAHPPKPPPLHCVDINPRTTGHSQRYALGKFLHLPQSQPPDTMMAIFTKTTDPDSSVFPMRTHWTNLVLTAAATQQLKQCWEHPTDLSPIPAMGWMQNHFP